MGHTFLIQDGFVLFFNTFFIEIERAALFAFVLIAAISDIKTRRIPNKLIFPGALMALIYHTLSPYGIGPLASLEGLAVGLFSFLPLYVIRAMGAGDVKLMAMVGTFLGPASAFGAVMTVLITGGLLAIAGAIKNGAARQMITNLRFIITGLMFSATTGTNIKTNNNFVPTGKIPYGIAIAFGTTMHLFFLRNGNALFS